MSESRVAYQSFVGVDLHKNTVTLAAVDPRGEDRSKLTISTKCREKIKAWLLALPRPSQLAVEAVGFVEWFIDDSALASIASTSPTPPNWPTARQTTEERSQRRPGRRQRLARGECPLGYIADDELMQLRKLGRHWRQLSSVVARSKHCMKSMLLAANLRGPKLDGGSAQRWLLAHGHLLKPAQRQAFANFTDIVQLIELQRAAAALRHHRWPAARQRFSPITKLLQTRAGHR